MPGWVPSTAWVPDCDGSLRHAWEACSAPACPLGAPSWLKLLASGSHLLPEWVSKQESGFSGELRAIHECCQTSSTQALLSSQSA